MKPKWMLFLLPVLLLCSAGGCQTVPNRSVSGDLVPFTTRHMEDFGEYLEEIQFYISRQVVLHRSVESETRDVTGTVHTIQIEKDTQIQSITFPARTPGVLFGVADGILNIQFEPARDGRRRTLPFRPRLPAKVADKPENVVFVFDQTEIDYDGSAYQVHFEKEDVAVTEADDTVFAEKARAEQEQFITKKRFPILLINPIRKISRFKEENRVVPGVWEEDPPD
jgi:hypothetical protein